MAFKHLQRNFLAITPTTTSFCVLDSRKLQHMAQIQCRAVQSRVDSQLPYLTAGCVCICSNHSRLGFSKIRVSCKPIRLNPESGLGCQFPRNSIVWSSNGGNRLYQRGRGFVNLIYPLSISGHAVTGAVSNCESVARRSFSCKRSFNCEMIDSREYAVAKAGRESEKSKNQKQVNAIPLHRTGDANLFPCKSQGKKIHATLLLAHRKVNGINSAEALFRDGEKAEESIQFGLTAGSEDNIHHSKKKAPARGKKKIQKPSEPPSPVAAKSSKETSLAKSHKKDKSGPPSETAAINSICNSSIEAADVAVSSKKLPKKSAKSRRKGNSVKETDVGGKANEASLKVERDAEQLSSRSESSQTLKQPASRKSKPQKANSLKPLYPPQGKSVVVVESHTKAKVIQGYLGDMYEVLPSNGHVRDLAARSGSVRPDEDFSMVWEVPSPAWTHLNNIKTAVIGADNLILASDPDREGEAIAWHIIEMLKQQDSLHDNITVARVVFQEITESAIKTALLSPRDVDVNLVHAYLARRALDYLIGFNISPLLWRKLPGCQSAGRVQSAALSLISDREIEIDEFKPQEYWTIGAIFKAGSSAYSIESYLTHFGSKKVNQMSVGSETEAKKMEQIINSSTFTVIASRRSQINRNPPTPYITSTLQQDAANKLNFSAAYTMKLAQKLYEGVELSHGKAMGLITYMRTDGLRISDEAVKGIRDLVVERYGQPFASESPRKYFRKVKNAQEAHEAVRPTDIRRLPSTLAGTVDEDALKLYALIWSRTMACQMESAKIDQIQLDISNDDKAISLRAVGSRLEFLGYRAVYEDVEVRAIRDSDNESSGRDEAFMILSNLKEGDSLRLDKVALEQHHTQPPPRFSEASLVKKLEELGIGRPSTYAMILKVLKDRNYVTMKSRVLYPEFRGRMVSAFLSHHFSEVTDYSFTADMETELDNVSAGLTEWKGLLKDYWTRFSTYCERASKVHIHQVEKLLERTFEDFLFSSLPDANRTCPSCYEGTLIFKVSRFGAGYFIGCDQHPRCKYIAKTIYGDEEEDITPSNNTVEEPKVLGLHPISQEKILLKSGPYGNYVQLGEDRKGYLPKRASVSQIKNAGSITVEEALDLLRYPITLGNHPKDGQPVVLKLAKLGFSIRYRRHIAPVPKNLKASDITFEKALELLKGDNVKQCGRPKTKKRTKDAVEAF